MFAPKGGSDPWFENRLVLRDFQAIAPGAGERSINLQRRDFVKADLSRIDLRRADLRDANLQNASLAFASLEGASLDDASLQGASLGGALLRGASLEGASLQGASLWGASLQGASLAGASLQGVSLSYAHLQGALLNYASLHGASLARASLQGAMLQGASLQGAVLTGASLQGAELDLASLNGALLDEASLRGASLDKTSLWRATIEGENDLHLARIRPVADDFVWQPRRGRVHSRRFQEWLMATRMQALSGVPDTAGRRPFLDELDSARQQVTKALTRLDFAAWPLERDRAQRAFWQAAARNGPDETSFQTYRVEELAKAACKSSGAPHVARGIVRNFLVGQLEVTELFDFEPNEVTLQLVEKILDPACRGARNLSDDERQYLIDVRDAAKKTGRRRTNP
jgi:uncharacterized protein YjbI with pentapeptide repeats